MSSVDFQGYIQYMFNLAIAVAAAAAVFMIVFGGFQYMTTDSWQGKSAGLDKARNAVYGLLLVLASYLILRTIDPRLVAIPSTLVAPLNINYGGLTTSESLLSTIASDANQYLSQDKQFMGDAAATQSKITDLESQKKALENKICSAPGNSCPGGPDVANQMCSDAISNKDDPIYNDCVALAKLNDQEGGLKGTLWTETAQHLMAGNLSACFSTGGAQSDPSAQADACHKMINDWANTYSGLSTGAGQSAQMISDYAAYANAIIDIQKTILAYNPGAASTINTLENIQSIASLGASKALGTNTIVSWLLPNSLTTSGTVKGIQSIADKTTIQDPSLRAQFVSQVQAYEAQLNGGRK